MNSKEKIDPYCHVSCKQRDLLQLTNFKLCRKNSRYLDRAWKLAI